MSSEKLLGSSPTEELFDHDDSAGISNHPEQPHQPPPYNAHPSQYGSTDHANPDRVFAIFGKESIRTNCPSCASTIRTTVTCEAGLMAWILGGLLCIIGCWPCCFIPCCLDKLKVYEHSCPSCKVVLGMYKGEMSIPCF